MARADADEVARVHAQVWRETYPGLMGPGTLDGLDGTRKDDDMLLSGVDPGVDEVRLVRR